MRRIGAWLIGLTLSLVLLPSPSIACGCGMAMNVTPGGHDFTLASGDTQAYLSLNHGTETLTFVRDFTKPHDQGKLLLVPVPADPTTSKIEIVDDVPTLNGVDVVENAKSEVTNWSQALLTSQIYPVILENWARPLGTTAVSSTGAQDFGMVGAVPNGITVHQHVEKNGLVAELVSATTADDLAQYFKAKQLPITPAQLPSLTTYIGQHAAFAAIWADPNATPTLPVESQLPAITPFGDSPVVQPNNIVVDPSPIQSGFTITFPSRTRFYPLLPSSAFGTTTITETLNVAGFVTPNLFADIKPHATVTYSRQSADGLTDTTKQFFAGSDPTYTTVTINAPSSAYSQDLTLTDQVPVRIRLADLLAQSESSLSPLETTVPTFIWGSLLFYLLSLAMLSFIIGALSGLIVFRSKANMWRFGIAGLWNILTIVGLAIATIVVQPVVVQSANTPEIPASNDRTATKKLLFIPLFSLLFVGAVIGVKLVLIAFLGQ